MLAEVVKAVDYGFDTDGGNYVAICNIHSTLVNGTYYQLVKIDTREFCDCCRGNCSGYHYESCKEEK